MTIPEAYQVLGLTVAASGEAAQDAYRRLTILHSSGHFKDPEQIKKIILAGQAIGFVPNPRPAGPPVTPPLASHQPPPVATRQRSSLSSFIWLWIFLFALCALGLGPGRGFLFATVFTGIIVIFALIVGAIGTGVEKAVKLEKETQGISESIAKIIGFAFMALLVIGGLAVVGSIFSGGCQPAEDQEIGRVGNP